MKTRKYLVIDEEIMDIISQKTKKLSEKLGIFVSKTSYVANLVNNFSEKNDKLIIKNFLKTKFDIEYNPDLDDAANNLENIMQGE